MSGHRSVAPGGIIRGVQTLQARLDHLVGCAWFWVWALVGFALALGAISLGPLLIGPLGLLSLAMAYNDVVRRSAFGLLAGAGGLCLLVTWLQQGASNLDARPWLIVGVALVIGGVVGHARRAD